MSLLGREFQTDDEKLVNLMATEPETLHKVYPGFHTAVTQCLRLLDNQRLSASLFTFFNYRLQAWALGFDADPTPPIRVIPVGIDMDPGGPVTFPLSVDDNAKIYPCSAPDCKVMRSKAEGGNIFTVCDKHWDEALEKPDHLKTCAELAPFVCCACGKQTCFKHGLPLAEEHQGKWKVETKTPRRCTPCADAGR